jgi:hypothetical protein
MYEEFYGTDLFGSTHTQERNQESQDKSEIGRIEDGAPLVSELCLNTEIKSTNNENSK